MVPLTDNVHNAHQDVQPALMEVIVNHASMLILRMVLNVFKIVSQGNT